MRKGQTAKSSGIIKVYTQQPVGNPKLAPINPNAEVKLTNVNLMKGSSKDELMFRTP